MWVAATGCFIGVALVILGGGHGVSANVWGIALALAVAASWASYAVAVAPLVKRYSPLRVNAVGTIVGSIPLVLIAEPQLAREHWGDVQTLSWLCVAYSLILAYLVTNAIWLKAIRQVGSSRAALYSNLQPFLGAMFAVIVLSENLTLPQVVGGGVITIGIIAARNQAPALGVGE
jgi:drug/metabolite transporter (DMT)-like permease